VYIWPLMTLLDQPVSYLLRLTFALIFTHPLKSIAITAATLLPLLVSLLLPPVFLLFVTLSTTAAIASYGTWLMIQGHLNSHTPEPS
ncbi:MAG: hypothetical protein K8I30_06225, partial [Anaerolineae bacterium]|nr:hypothetical protein [Anaerolineae bacterium]